MSKPQVVPRRMHFDFSDLPKHWFGGNAVATHAANGLHILFPEGERFFIRSVRRFLGPIDDPELKTRVRGFFAQEALHGQAHDDVIELLEAQGYSVRRFLKVYKWLAFEVAEPLAPASMSLSVTVALEHLTACMAESAFVDGRLDHAYPAMRELFLWHSAEEIEHKSVAFDVFNAVDGRYWLRILGMLVGLSGLFVFSTVASRRLLRQDRLTRGELRRQRRTRRRGGLMTPTVRAGIRDYFRRGFHPDQLDNYHRVATWAAEREVA